jgi:membrane fusion protein (multidrug efflux system)
MGERPREHASGRPGALLSLTATGARQLACLVVLAACGCGKEAPPAAQGAQAAPAPDVEVITARPERVANTIEVPGRLQAVRIAEVRARVNGIVERRLYDEGTDVKEGQPLFAIDPRELRAQLDAAQAALARAQATAANAGQDVKRYDGLVAQQAISQQEYDTAVARLRTAQADVSQAKAQVEAARLSLSYTTVRAPISGRAGRAQVTEGALVSAASATLLTTIEQLDPIYVNFSLASLEVQDIRREIAAGTLKVPSPSEVPVQLVVEDGSVYPRPGHINFFDLRIDEQTGATALRAVFPNPDRMLLPGQFVRVRIEAGERPNAVMVPQRAVTITPQGASVLVVDEQGNAQARPVKTGDLRGGSWVILEGLEAGDRVIVEGLQKVQPGKPVHVAGGPPQEQSRAPGQPDPPPTSSASQRPRR